MEVRDRLLKKSEYKGRMTEASGEDCPCRPCYNAHDCGYTHSYHGWVVRMACSTRDNHGCPSPKREPEHRYSSDRARKCLRCGAWRKLEGKSDGA